jgi:cytochrome c oxidase subunit II
MLREYAICGSPSSQIVSPGLDLHQASRADDREKNMRIESMVYGAATAALASLIFAPSSWALAGQAVPWQMGLQDFVTPVGEYINWFHNWLMVTITLITLFVLALLVYVMVKFNAKANPVPSKTTHNALIEVIWTVVPVLILVAIAIPSLRLLYLQRDIPAADMTLKVIGNPSWNWTYEYPDLGVNEDGSAKVSFTAYLKPEDQAKTDGVPYLLATDVPVIVPVNKTVKLIVTSDPEGIIHAWTIPSFGMKIDAIPGRLNEDWFRATKEGVYYGQCSELCGKDHAYMPIEVHVVSEADFAAWSEKVKTASAETARDFLFALLKAKGQQASN